MRCVSEEEFNARIWMVLAPYYKKIGSITGPGRSGAIAAVYASYILHKPFIPYGEQIPTHLGRLLIIDTARASGKTLRKAERQFAFANPLTLAVFEEPPRVCFWYEMRQ